MRTKKIKALCNLIEAEITTYRTAKEQMVYDHLRRYLGVSSLGVTEYIFTLLTCFEDMTFYPDSDYVDTERDKIVGNLRDEIGKTEDEDVKQELQESLALQESQEMSDYRRENMLIARDTLKDFWENRNGDIAHDWRLYGNVHQVVTDHLYACYAEAKMKLPTGNQELAIEKKAKKHGG